ncbi:MAG: hypothetical protein R2754_18770, partial [Microthrixaceae bacterium]
VNASAKIAFVLLSLFVVAIIAGVRRSDDPQASTFAGIEARHPALSDLSLESGERFDRQRKDAVSMFGMDVPASHTQQFRSDPGVAVPTFQTEAIETVERLGWSLGPGHRPSVLCGVQQNREGTFDYVEVDLKTDADRAYVADVMIRLAESPTGDLCETGIGAA